MRRTWRRSHHHGEWSVHAASYDERSGSIYTATINPENPSRLYA